MVVKSSSDSKLAASSNVVVYRYNYIAATLSNCGDTLKLVLPSHDGNMHDGQVNDLGYGKNVQDDNNGQSAAKL